MATSTAFLPKTTTKTLTAGAASSSASWSSADCDGDCVRILNLNTEPVFVRIGKGAQTATLSDIPVGAGATAILGCAANADTIAVIVAGAGVLSVFATKGEGV